MSKFLSGSALEGLAPGLDFAVYSLGFIFVLVLALWLVRRVAGGTFIAGGIHRHRRLAILDAAAVDTKRRLVLVRRDDREHLLLIGGATDVVVEQNIRHEAAEDAKEPKTAAAAGKDVKARSAQPSAQPASLRREENPAQATPAANEVHSSSQEAPASARRADAKPELAADSGKPAPARPLAPEPNPQQDLRAPQPVRQQPATTERPERQETVRRADAYQRVETGSDIAGVTKRDAAAEQSDTEQAEKDPGRPKPLDDEMERLLKELSSGR